MIRFIKSLLLVFTLAACSSNGLNNQQAQQNRELSARELEKQGRLYDALIQWKVLTQLDNSNIEYQQQYKKLHNQIDVKATILKSKLPSNPSQKFKSQYLKLLALEPDNKQALDALKHIQWQQSLSAAKQKTQVIKEYFTQVQSKANESIAQNKYKTNANTALNQKNYAELLKLSREYLNKEPKSILAKDNTYIALTGLAENALAKKDTDSALSLLKQSLLVDSRLSKKQNVARIKRIKSDRAEEAYKQGLLLFKSNISAAIEFFKQAVALDASHYKARQQLQRAQKIQSNLQKIRLNH